MEALLITIIVVVYVIGGIYRLVKAGLAAIGKSAAIAPGRAAAPLPPTSAVQQPAFGRPPPASGQRVRQPQGQPRRPDAGGPAVSAPASDDQFRRQIQQGIAEEPQPFSMAQGNVPTAPSNQTFDLLFNNPNTVVRAIILQEVLGPPLSRRHLNRSTRR